MAKTYSSIEVQSRQELRDWLANHHAQKDSVWLITYKKHCGDKYLAFETIVQECLCYGWIDSVTGKVDGERTKRLISPRKPKSPWSKVNKDHVAFLLQAGLMTPAGLAKVELAKQNGSWQALDDVEALIIPPELKAAFKDNPKAKQHFDASPPSAQKSALYWLHSAKRPETRQKRITQIIQLTEKNIRVNAFTLQDLNR